MRAKVSTLPSLGRTGELALAIQGSLAVLQCLKAQIQLLEQTILAQAHLSPSFQPLLTVCDISIILTLSLMLETGNIRHVAKVGQYTSYC